jgi:hypothetical protein
VAALLGGHAVFRIALRLVELLARQLAVGDRIGAADIARHLAVGDAAHLQRVQAAEVGDLLEGERGVVDQPDGGRLGHQDIGHGPSQKQRRPALRPGGGVVGSYIGRFRG